MLPLYMLDAINLRKCYTGSNSHWPSTKEQQTSLQRHSMKMKRDHHEKQRQEENGVLVLRTSLPRHVLLNSCQLLQFQRDANKSQSAGQQADRSWQAVLEDIAKKQRKCELYLCVCRHVHVVGAFTRARVRSTHHLKTCRYIYSNPKPTRAADEKQGKNGLA